MSRSIALKCWQMANLLMNMPLKRKMRCMAESLLWIANIQNMCRAQPRRKQSFMKKGVSNLTGERTATIRFAGPMLHFSKLYSVSARVNTSVDA